MNVLDPATRRHVDKQVDDLAHEFDGVFTRETVERFVDESLAGLSRAASRTTFRCWFTGLRGSACGRSARPRGRSPRTSRRCSSSASRTPAARRWPRG